MGKQGFVSRQIIETAIAIHLAEHGLSTDDARARARSYISDFKKEVSDQDLAKIVLNAGDRELEQYRYQELGEWLYRRRGPLKDFRTNVCPFKARFDVSVIEAMEIHDVTQNLSQDDLNDPERLFSITIEQAIEIEKLKAELAKYQEKEAATRIKQGLNSKGRPRR